ncbi:MAG TPA: DUF3828 domain-containing protein [Allosphingosinicella sp.]|nr:DUF3828 domain-containing protein [Allosphingosinicella sp.]
MSLAFAAALLAAAPTAESPRAFVERLYAGYRDPDYDPLARPERIFAPALVAAIREDRKLSRDEVGYMDADPLCQCQDAAGLRAQIGDARPWGRGAAAARVRIDLAGSERRDLRLKFVQTAAGWRISDIATTDEPSLLAGLKRFNRRREGR